MPWFQTETVLFRVSNVHECKKRPLCSSTFSGLRCRFRESVRTKGKVNDRLPKLRPELVRYWPQDCLMNALHPTHSRSANSSITTGALRSPMTTASRIQSRHSG